MCPFKPLSELVLKCDTGINLSESCCGGVEPPLMEIFGRAATSFRGRVTAVAESQTRRGFWETGEDIWRVWACMGPRAFCAWGPASTMLEGSRFYTSEHSFFFFTWYVDLSLKITCLQWRCNNCPHYRRTASTCSYTANSINLNTPQTASCFLNNPLLKMCF